MAYITHSLRWQDRGTLLYQIGKCLGLLRVLPSEEIAGEQEAVRNVKDEKSSKQKIEPNMDDGSLLKDKPRIYTLKQNYKMVGGIFLFSEFPF